VSAIPHTHESRMGGNAFRLQASRLAGDEGGVRLPPARQASRSCVCAPGSAGATARTRGCRRGWLAWTLVLPPLPPRNMWGARRARPMVATSTSPVSGRAAGSRMPGLPAPARPQRGDCGRWGDSGERLSFSLPPILHDPERSPGSSASKRRQRRRGLTRSRSLDKPFEDETRKDPHAHR